ncbi:MAG: alpha/beta fold hydrolase [Proteobacteria bacterium]|nr:alpha/beta fold hydrolase [Pseudomonadota bacterium]HQR04657.1 alpha/beta fold hydrolase [Rhodocyclaceae bacterium]
MSLLETRTVGSGPNLTLVHGWGLGPSVWVPVLPLLAEHFTVHVLALPGYAACPPVADYGIEALADELAAQLPPRAMVCGWSLGALVCLACAARHPHRVARMALVGTTASFLQRPGWAPGLAPTALEDFLARFDADGTALLKHFAALIHHGDDRARQAQRILSHCLQAGPPADSASLRAGLETLGRTDLRTGLDDISQPALLVHGSVDPLMPLAAAEALAQRLPRGRLAVFGGSAHAPFASDPERFVMQVAEFAGGGG